MVVIRCLYFCIFDDEKFVHVFFDQFLLVVEVVFEFVGKHTTKI